MNNRVLRMLPCLTGSIFRNSLKLYLIEVCLICSPCRIHKRGMDTVSLSCSTKATSTCLDFYETMPLEGL